MSWIAILLLGIGLAMDAFAVSICKGLALRHVAWKECLKAALWFGIFQGLMPALGYIFGNRWAGYIEAFSSWIGFILLALIGGNMVRESLSEEEETDGSMDFKSMLLLAIATSIDALAVGLAFSVVPVKLIGSWTRFANTMLACLIICLETSFLSAIGIKVGAIFGSRFEKKAEMAGGIILILIGLQIILSHYGIF